MSADSIVRDGEAHPQKPRAAGVAEAAELVEIVGRGSQILSDYGPAAVIICVFLVVFVATLWVVRSDFVAADKARTDTYERVARVQAEADERKHKLTIETFSRMHADHRDDAKDERTGQRERDGKMWQGIRDLRDAALEQTQAVKDLTAEIRKNLK
jgi:hypothetical protein